MPLPSRVSDLTGFDLLLSVARTGRPQFAGRRGRTVRRDAARDPGHRREPEPDAPRGVDRGPPPHRAGPRPLRHRGPFRAALTGASVPGEPGTRRPGGRLVRPALRVRPALLARPAFLGGPASRAGPPLLGGPPRGRRQGVPRPGRADRK